MPIQIYDKIALDAVSDIKLTDEGYLEAPAKIARAGIYEYYAFELGELFDDRKWDDIIRVYRSEDEVFADQAMRSFESKPVTEGHPWEQVNAGNVKEHQVGLSMKDMHRQDIYMAGTLLIQDASAVNRVQRGKCELSAGYECDVIRESGEWNGQRYDAKQAAIRGNHIALVDAGRAGAECRVGDRAPMMVLDRRASKPNQDHRSQNMPQDVNLQKITHDGFTGQVDDTAKAIFDKMKSSIDALQAQVDAKDSELKDAKAAHDKDVAAKDAKIAELEAAQPTADAIEKMAEERAAVVSVAGRVLGDEFTAKGKSNAEIKKAVCEAKIGDKVNDKSEAYIDAYFDSVADALGDASDDEDDQDFGRDNLSDALGKSKPNKSKSADNDRQQYDADMRDAWKGNAA